MYLHKTYRNPVKHPLCLHGHAQTSKIVISKMHNYLYALIPFLFHPQTCVRWRMGVCTVECSSGSCHHVFRWGFTFSDEQHSSIQVPFSIETLTCLILSSFYLPPQQLHDLRVAAGAHTEQLVSGHSCICGLSRTGQCCLCCCRLCHFYWLYTR